MANRIRYGVINYLLFNKKKKKLGFDKLIKNYWVFSLQRLHFFQIDTQFRTTTFSYFDVLFPKGNFRLKAMRKVLSVMVVGGKIWVLAGQCRRLACLIRQYNLYAERCCIDYWFHFLLKTLIFTFIFKSNLSNVYFLSQFFFIVLLH